MANKNFYVHNGLTVGGLTIDATTSTLVTSGLLITTSTTAATTVTSGAFQVRGGAGIVGDLYVGGNIYDGGHLVLNANNIGSYAVTSITAGSSTQVVGTTGAITINSTDTLQSVTERGATTNQAIRITNATQATNSTTGALVVTGGIGLGGNAEIGGDLDVWGRTTFAGPVTFNGTATYVYSTNAYYTDNLIHLHESSSTQVEQTWTFDDGKDVGFKFHYFNRADNTGTAAGLILANDTQWLEWYDRGTEGSSSTFVGTSYGNFKLGKILLADSTNASSTTTGALVVTGGAGIGKDLYVGGTIYAANITGPVTGTSSSTNNIVGGTAGQIVYQSAPNTTAFAGPGTSGQLLRSNGTSAPSYVNTSSIYVGAADAVKTQVFSANTNHFIAMFNTSTAGVLTPGVDLGIYYNPSTNTLYAGTFNGAFSGNGSGLTNIPNSALDNSSITINSGTGISVSGSPVSLGSSVTITNTGVTQFLGGTTGLTGTNQTGVVTLTGTLGIANGGTNNTTIGSAGTIAYSDGTKYAFLSSSTNGYLLTQGTNTLNWVAPGTFSVGTATNLSGITQGAIPVGSATAGVVSYIPAGTDGQVLTMSGSTTATWKSIGAISGVGSATTATNLAGGSLGTIPYQTAAGLTSFIGTGTAGSLLQMGATTASFVAAGAVSVGVATTATNIAGGVAGRIPIQSSGGITSFITSGTNGQVLVQATNTATFVNQSTLSVGTATNVSGGAAGTIVMQTGAGATSFISAGSAGQMLVYGASTATWTNTSSIYVGRASLADSATVATDVSGGTAGQLLYQSAPNATDYVGPGTAGQILQSAGASAPVYVNQSTLSVGTATNIGNGAAGSIPIQTGAGATSFIPIGTAGFVLTAAAGNTATWQALSGLASGSATTATNIAGGTAGQVPYQTGAGATSFAGPGTAGQVLVSRGTSGPIYQSTLTLAGGVASTNTLTGTLVVNGGVGISGDVNVGGDITFTSSTTAIIQSENGVTVQNSAVTVDTWSSSTFRSAKYVVSVSRSDAWQTTEILVIHGAGTAYMHDTSVFTGAAPIMNFDTIISGGNVLLQATGTTAVNHTVKVHRVYLTA